MRQAQFDSVLNSHSKLKGKNILEKSLYISNQTGIKAHGNPGLTTGHRHPVIVGPPCHVMSYLG